MTYSSHKADVDVRDVKGHIISAGPRASRKLSSRLERQWTVPGMLPIGLYELSSRDLLFKIYCLQVQVILEIGSWPDAGPYYPSSRSDVTSESNCGSAG